MPILDKDAVIKTCKRLPFTIDTEVLLREVKEIPEQQWSHQRSNVHQDAQAIFVKGYPAREKKPDDDREILVNLPHIRKIIYDTFPGKPGKCLLADLKPGGIVKLHKDKFTQDPNDFNPVLDYFLSTFRIHIPLTTQPNVQFYCYGEFFHFPVGSIWTINNHSKHSVINQDTSQSRIHLILDIFPDKEFVELIKEIPPEKGKKNDKLYDYLKKISSNPER